MRIPALCLLMLSTFALASGRVSSASARAAIELGPLLDQYAAGQFEAALAAAETGGGDAAIDLRDTWALAGRAWIDATPVGRAERLLIAASFALEIENRNTEHGRWQFMRQGNCSASC